jgi:hypothetical protein
MVTIPLRSLSKYTFGVTLEDVPYIMTVRWNVRGAYYTLDILSSDDVLLLGGIKLVINSGGLIRKFPRPGMPPGELLAIDAGNDNTPIVFGDLDERVELVYLTDAEYVAIS